MLNKRLSKIADLISNESSVVDVGCDHGYLSVLLRRKGNNQLLINCDNKIGPLNSAKENLSKYQNIEFYCIDGLQANISQCDIINIAGMGFHTVIHILENNMSYARNAKQIIIQVNNDVDKMRKWLNENDFYIVNEAIVLDYKYYQIIVAENHKQTLNDIEIEFGPVLIKNREKTFIDYLNSLVDKYTEIIRNIDKNDVDYINISNKIERIKKILND